MVCENVKQLQNVTNTLTHTGKSWEIAKPLASPNWNFRSRVRGAWLLLTGKAFAVRWF
ncbi:Uncharacterised protein [uncultured archaeon]|nr:Uncharacterised protein [uncultured archaeon]